MIRSMTGFGAASRESETLRASVSVRGLNHRFLDISVQAPRSLRSLEPRIREQAQTRAARGRLEVVVQATHNGNGASRVTASQPLIEGLVRTLREIQAHHGLEGGVQVADVARFPGVIEVEAAAELGEAEAAEILELLGEALDELDQMRATEGKSLETHLRTLLEGIGEAARRIEDLAGEGIEKRREGLLEKVRTLQEEFNLDEARLYQEVVRAADRHDVNEEVQRLGSHVSQAQGLLAGDEPCGERLDFLAQELMREANTVGSKAASAPLVQEVVKLKTQIERLREQVQNVE